MVHTDRVTDPRYASRLNATPGTVTAAVALLCTTPVATWWLLNIVVTSENIAKPDYMVRPIDISPVAELIVGLTALVIALSSIAFLVKAEREQRFGHGCWSVLFPLIAAAAVCGAAWSTVTAPTIGANIGGGMVIMFGVPVVAALVAVATHRWSSLRRARF